MNFSFVKFAVWVNLEIQQDIATHEPRVTHHQIILFITPAPMVTVVINYILIPLWDNSTASEKRRTTAFRSLSFYKCACHYSSARSSRITTKLKPV